MIQKLKQIIKRTFIYKIYLILFAKPLNKWRTAHKKRKNNRRKHHTLKVLYPRIYKKYARNPVDERKVVFIENRVDYLPDSFEVLYDTLKMNYDLDLRCCFLRELNSNRDEYQQRCIETIKEIATAKYVFLADCININCGFDIRPETVVTQLWHGCGAFKKFGFSNADGTFGASMKEMEEYSYYRGYTHATVSSPQVMWAYEEAMRYPHQTGVVKPLGISRTDVFFDPDFISEAYDALYEAMPVARNKKVILYAPTFRGSAGKAKFPSLPDIDLLQRAFGGKYVFLIKQHPFVKKPTVIPARNIGFARDVTDSMTIDQLLCVSDICISDYSSLIFEYSLFEKPLLFYASNEDMESFLQQRGFFYDYNEFTPGPVVKSTEELINCILNINDYFDHERIKAFREKFMSSCDGHSTERILDVVLTKEAKEKYLRKTPLEKKKYHLDVEVS